MKTFLRTAYKPSNTTQPNTHKHSLSCSRLLFKKNKKLQVPVQVVKRKKKGQDTAEDHANACSGAPDMRPPPLWAPPFPLPSSMRTLLARHKLSDSHCQKTTETRGCRSNVKVRFWNTPKSHFNTKCHLICRLSHWLTKTCLIWGVFFTASHACYFIMGGGGGGGGWRGSTGNWKTTTIPTPCPLRHWTMRVSSSWICKTCFIYCSWGVLINILYTMYRHRKMNVQNESFAVCFMGR